MPYGPLHSHQRRLKTKMIIPPHNSADPTTSELKAHPDTENGLAGEAPPPSYYGNPLEQDVTANASSSSTPLQPTFKSKPTNYLHLFNENSSVKGEFVIDPCMDIPTSLLPPIGPEEDEADRKNLSLHSTNGSVNAQIWLLSARDPQPFDSKKPTKRTILDVGSEHGSVTVRVQTIHGAAPFLLTISARNGAVNVTLPRSFIGLLLLTNKHGSISLADNLSENCTHLSQVDSTRRYFVGDLSMVDDSGWAGDELRVEGKNGQIRVKYFEELTSADNTSKGGLLNRLFGW
ncbi:hypothetical protein DEU56DRAFT_289787 [Suillus clintonianus]|uniref:uncharacterized protein n=1 Tax=Suillus clintonianus TaxID=1904413 RepID=UPI001B886474|nr:uncharacterized protein DEU56DRAFT_289787 [Suillus clintonianus]KAG2140684.1 hypothetical protein DEU56DRAFT_289787 [Suillus clintonianus]